MAKGTLLSNQLKSAGPALLFIFTFILFSHQVTQAQTGDSLAFSDSKAAALKYLRTLAEMEKESCIKQKFFDTYNVDLSSGHEVIMVLDSWILLEPAEGAKLCKTVIPKGSVARIYKSNAPAGFQAVKYLNSWGFIKTEAFREMAVNP
ncbi:MAG: hypothetical protein Kow00127_13990 [Bacteroidales bacterium]